MIKNKNKYTDEHKCEMLKIAATYGDANARRILEDTYGIKLQYSSSFYTYKESDCFITTAVCESSNKPDDCYELTVLRDYRDNWLKYHKDGRTLVYEYYAIAPKIVAKIDKQRDSKYIYHNLLIKYILPCVKHIEKKENEMALDLYIKMVKELESRYL